MSDSEEENFCYYGKPLTPYDEDTFPKKKPISVEDQVATDAQGRRRFHGAFTGGFSAGFFNTVGSLEGWLPGEFKSSRQEKSEYVQQNPEDFMDDEDIGEFGIAPQTVRATKDYSTSKKRKRMIFSDGPIPGEPVLHSILSRGNETVGYLLLKNIGIQDKVEAQRNEIASSSTAKVYGCEMPKPVEIPKELQGKDYKIPEIYLEFLKHPKSNTFGLGYSGLNKGHVNLFKSNKLVVRDKNKKLSIAGQAFGVGAFEEDDEDIYSKEDMSNYDFELTGEKDKNIRSKQNNLKFDLFAKAKDNFYKKEMFPPPIIPHSFSGKHKVKKSRFEPIPEEETVTVPRKAINPMVRAKYLGESTDEVSGDPSVKKTKAPNETEQSIKQENSDQNKFDFGSAFDRFVPASKKEDVSNILEVVQKTETEHGTQEMRDAAKMKLFGPLTRITTDWQPCSLLCKRFNVPEPNYDGGKSLRNRKRTKHLIFEYQKHQDEETVHKPGLSVQAEDNSTQEIKIEVDGEAADVTSNEIPNVGTSTTQISPDPDVVEIKSEIGNLPKDDTDKIGIEENIDLFKAVFLSSDESEDDEGATEAKNEHGGKDKRGEQNNRVEQDNREENDEREEEIRANVLTDQLTSRKIKTNTKGLLSDVDFSVFTNTGSVPERKDVLNSEGNSLPSQAQINSYGPKLPEQKALVRSTYETKKVSSSEDEWVEKDLVDKKKKKHKKEKKKHKHKHKKSR